MIAITMLLSTCIAPIPEGAKRLPVAPPPRPVMVHEGDDDSDWIPEIHIPPGVVPDI